MKYIKMVLSMAGVVLTGLALAGCGAQQATTQASSQATMQADLTETYVKLLDTDEPRFEWWVIDEGKVEYTQATCNGGRLNTKVEVTGTLAQPEGGTSTITWDGYGPLGGDDRTSTVEIDNDHLGLRGQAQDMWATPGFEDPIQDFFVRCPGGDG